MQLAQIAVGVLGVLLVTSEYATGLIRTTFAAVPRRLPVLWGKAALVAAATVAVEPAGRVRRLRGRPVDPGPASTCRCRSASPAWPAR